MEVATFGAGCFWGVEAKFRELNGVIEATSGYSGGNLENPTYKQVCSDKTGHAEVVQVQYEPTKISYIELLKVFFAMHDPTTINRQGPDVGSQYRSAIFYHSEEQRLIAEEIIQELTSEGRFKSPIVTKVEKAKTFYPAEDYHQRYYEKNGLNSCKI